MRMNRGVISHYLSNQFRKLGQTVATYPGYFILFPIFTALVLSTGLQRLEEANDIEQLITPDNSRTVKEKQRINTLFPTQNGANFFPGRESGALPGGAIIITPSSGKSIFVAAILEEVLLVDELVRNLTITAEDRQWKYTDLCAKNNQKCFKNNVLTIYDKVGDIISGNYSIKYPISFTNHGQNFKYFGDSLGGVTLDDNGNVLNAQAIRLFYILNGDTNWKKRLAKKWELAFLDCIESIKFNNIVIDGIALVSEERELNMLLPNVLSLFPFAMVAVLLFSALTCLSKDWIQSKPWTGVITSTSAALALGSGFGLIVYSGVKFTVMLAPVPFLILGVGMDDTFVLLAAWRRTDPKKSVAERMGEAYGESSVAITITSLTNFIAFISGVATSFPAVRIFSVYAASAVCFSYVYQITFIGACMSFCGYLEEQNRHSLMFIRLVDSNGKINFRSSSKYFPHVSLDVWEHLGKALSKWPVKVAAMVLMTAYLSIGFYGTTAIKYMDDIRDIALYDSHFDRFIENSYKYFYNYDLSIQIVIDEELDYADPLVQSQIEDLLSKIESSNYVADSSLTESWLRYYLKFQKDERIRGIIKDYNMNNTTDFIEVLRDVFLHIPAAERFKLDIAFNQDYTSILASRFICRSYTIRSQDDYYSVIRSLRKIASESSFKVFPYHTHNFVLDEVDVLGKITLQTMCVVIGAIFVTCLLFMPDFVTVISVMFTVISIEASVLGYMALWDIALAPITMIIVITCAGFAVDYAAHLCYAYKIAESHNPNQCLQRAISCVGMAIFQGSATTIISLLPLSYPIANSLVISLKIVSMMILFSATHALVFLPTILSSIHFLLQRCRGKKAQISLVKEKNLATGENFNIAFQEHEV